MTVNAPLNSPPPKLDILYAWIASLRLKTLPLACGGIVTGSALAAASGVPWQGRIFWVALATALLLQLLANLANDYGDFTKSADTPNRIGPKRGMQLGLISPAEMKNAIWLTAFLAVLSGMALMGLACATWLDGLIFLALGGLSIVAALTYTIGRHAYGYYGLGDCSVLIFFGWVAVLGSYYLQTRQFDLPILLPATACGLLSVLVLNVNNLRDLEEDRLHGKITLAARLGAHGARYYHLLLLAASLTFLVASAWRWSSERPWVWLCLLSLPFFYKNAWAALRDHEPEQFRAQLAVALKTGITALGGFAVGLSVVF
jgi:1,4-dihydroxy-2-naphthoate octaprenyltransferase